MSPKGSLIIIGGNEDKGIDTNEEDHLEFIERSILSRIVREMGGTDASVVIIPTASRIPVEVAENYVNAFEMLGCKNIDVADIRSREDAENDEYLQLIEKADCILFSGGNQSQITHKIGGTVLHDLLEERYQDEKIVIAGTSAGAMCMSKEMIAGGCVKEVFSKGAIKMDEGLGLMPHLIIDSHFIRRGRFGRVSEAVARFPRLIGVGLAENTGLIVTQGNSFEVIGSGMVILFDGSDLGINNYNTVEIGHAMTISNLTTHVLAKGYCFNIQDRTITVAPADSPVFQDSSSL